MSKLPSLAVAECPVGPLFVQVTVSPTLTVTVPGENWKSLIVTPVEAAAMASGLSFSARPGASSRSTCGSAAGGRGGGGGRCGRGGRGGLRSSGRSAGGAGAGSGAGAGAAAAGAGAAAGSSGDVPGCEADRGAAIASAATTA